MHLFNVDTRAILFLSLVFIISTGCDSHISTSSQNQDQSDGGWLIPQNQIVDGFPGPGGIPSIDNPQFKTAQKIDYLDSTDLVIGVQSGNKIKAYPHKILNWHEIINDQIDSRKLAITYCPLTATGIGWNRAIHGKTIRFSVSGLIYRNNLILYDRETDSHWSQMMNKSIEGKYAGHKIELIDVVETQWSTWKQSYPNSRVLTKNTGYDKNYNTYPYGDYKSNNELFLFPRPESEIDKVKPRLPLKARVHGIIIQSRIITFPIRSFNDSLEVYNFQFNNKKIVVFGSKRLNIVESYNRVLNDGTTLTFEAVHRQLPIVMKDQQGTYWTIMGNAVKGPRKGEKLSKLESYNGFWFAFKDFFPTVRIHYEFL